jgi:ABC-type Fe3+/spermidine/putrescine transport system ATPase subunit
MLRGRDVARVPAYQRQIGLVFQSYALFPHMSVAENIAYGLRMRRVKRDEIRRRVDRVLETVQLGPLGQRLPRQLSGGQQQRVALARAIVVEPQILLLDEPFSNLDQRLRQELRHEVRSLQRSLGITSVFVTHDQEEALTMADRIAVLHLGRLQQIGTPDDLYERPASSFVARFLGDCNLLRGTLDVVEANRARLRTPAGLCAEGVPAEGTAFSAGMSAEAMVRPERIRIAAAPEAGTESSDNSVTGRVEAIVYRGSVRRYLVRSDRDAATMVADAPNTGAVPSGVGEGAAVQLSWAATDCRVLATDA